MTYVRETFGNSQWEKSCFPVLKTVCMLLIRRVVSHLHDQRNVRRQKMWGHLTEVYVLSVKLPVIPTRLLSLV